jgi:uncharacterized membrane protein YczE
MLVPQTSWLSVGILVVMVFGLWVGLSSEWMSGPTVGWMSAVVVGIVAVTLMAMRAGRPTRSVAHVLHDAEEPKSMGR